MSLGLAEKLNVAAFELILVGAPRWMVTAVYEAAYRLKYVGGQAGQADTSSPFSTATSRQASND